MNFFKELFSPYCAEDYKALFIPAAEGIGKGKSPTESRAAENEIQKEPPRVLLHLDDATSPGILPAPASCSGADCALPLAGVLSKALQAKNQDGFDRGSTDSRRHMQSLPSKGSDLSGYSIVDAAATSASFSVAAADGKLCTSNDLSDAEVRFNAMVLDSPMGDGAPVSHCGGVGGFLCGGMGDVLPSGQRKPLEIS